MAVSPKNHRRLLIVALTAVAAVVILLVFLSYNLLAFGDPGAVSLSSSLNATTFTQNQTVRVSVTDRNNLYFNNELPLSGDWKIQGLSMGPCASYAAYPFGIALYQGRYTLDNISSAKAVVIYAPGIYNCPVEGIANSIRFGPLQNISVYVDLKGYWTEGLTKHPDGGVSEGVLHRFVPGVYTTMAGDEWGHTKILYFQVGGIGLEDFSLCPSNCVYPAPHLTGLIYFCCSSPPKSLRLLVNGTDEGVEDTSGSTLSNFALWYKGGFQQPEVISGNTYVIRFVVVFEDNSTASATTIVVAG